MHDDANLMLAWERGYGRLPFEQALVLLQFALPAMTTEELMDISLGQRDATLLALRKSLFGSRMASLAHCPNCNESLELNFDVDDISVESPSLTYKRSVEVDGLRVDFRPPNSCDLARLVHVDPKHRADRLLEHCVLQLRSDGQPYELASIGQETREAIARAVAESDPQSDIQLALTCVDCGHQWNSPFDVVGFLWAELNGWCQSLMAELHLLAKHYGWSESESLSLSRWRRQVYLGMVRQ